ncbi:MAG: hypothetical protein APF80_17415 [Alphaproteobacteria bacterium BRH_c36]|nr:MAG: hypothetical protein APF80_17415 [Alphaproteobacteria bacterium BRH_c36]
MSEKTSRIRELNDQFRRTFTGGRVVTTIGVNSLPTDMMVRALEKVKEFSDFTDDNDPWGEHDFGSFEHDGQKFFFKLDYYDNNLEFGSEDPSDPVQTTRVLTVMLAEEY